MDHFNPSTVIPMMKMRRMDRASRMLIYTMKSMIDSDCEGWGLYVGTYSAGSDAVEQFLARYLDEGPLGANPMVFPNTVLNAAAGQAAIFYGLKGPNSTQCQNLLAGTAAVQAAFHHLQRNDLTVIAGAVDIVAEHQLRVWRGMHGYGSEFLIGEGVGLLKLSRRPSAVQLLGFSQGRLSTPVFQLPTGGEAWSQQYSVHCEKFGRPDRVYPFSFSAEQTEVQMTAEMNDIDRIELGANRGISSSLPVQAMVHACTHLKSGESADILAFGFAGDFLVTRIKRLTD